MKVVDQDANRLDRVSSIFLPSHDPFFLCQVCTEALVVAPTRTEEGEQIPIHPVPIVFGISGHSTDVPFLWPVTLLHHIDEDSPFWKVNRCFPARK